MKSNNVGGGFIMTVSVQEICPKCWHIANAYGNYDDGAWHWKIVCDNCKRANEEGVDGKSIPVNSIGGLTI